MRLLTDSTYEKSTATSILLHGALLVAFILMPPSAPHSVKKVAAPVELLQVPAPKQEIVTPKQEVAPMPEKAQMPQEQASLPSPAPQAAALPGETGPTSVALQSGTGSAIPASTGISPAITNSGGSAVGHGSGSVAASRTYSPKPSYPRAAREAGWEGNVELSIRINSDGSVTVLSVLESARQDASNAAAQAVSTWRYSPKRDANGVPVSSVRTVKVKFDLTEAD